MRKPFLLIAGENCYPEARTGDWIGCFETEEDALAVVNNEPFEHFFKGNKVTGRSYKVSFNGSVKECDWFEVVDLRHWAGMEELEVD